MFVLPKGTLVKFHGLPFTLLDDVPTDGSEVNYKLALSQPDTSAPSEDEHATLGMSLPEIDAPRERFSLERVYAASVECIARMTAQEWTDQDLETQARATEAATAEPPTLNLASSSDPVRQSHPNPPEGIAI